jgi:hypothetical protein
MEHNLNISQYIYIYIYIASNRFSISFCKLVTSAYLSITINLIINLN